MSLKDYTRFLLYNTHLVQRHMFSRPWLASSSPLTPNVDAPFGCPVDTLIWQGNLLSYEPSPSARGSRWLFQRPTRVSPMFLLLACGFNASFLVRFVAVDMRIAWFDVSDLRRRRRRRRRKNQNDVWGPTLSSCQPSTQPSVHRA